MEKLSNILVVTREPDATAPLLDKAVALARRFGARIELMLPDATTAAAFASLCQQRGCEDLVSYVLHGSHEWLTDVLVRRLREHPVDLVMKHPARPPALRRLAGGMGDVEIVARTGTPVLLVGDARWPAEPRFAAAVDISNREGEIVARSIVHAAGFLAQGCEATIEVLYSEREKHDERLRTERAVQLARLVREFRIGGERLQRVEGSPEATLPPLVAAARYDLLVVGALSREHRLFPGIHSLTSLLIDASCGDVLLIDLPRHEIAPRVVAPRRDLHP
jgi:nucleotide-binding universal stress UspA family protein